MTFSDLFALFGPLEYGGPNELSSKSHQLEHVAFSSNILQNNSLVGNLKISHLLIPEGYGNTILVFIIQSCV